jgi:chromosome segregation ATPase
MTRRTIGATTVFCLACLLVSGLVSAQAPAPQRDASIELLLAEVRGLRAELNQAVSAGIRAQLLVARLQLQEQRINDMVRQLTRAQNELASVSAQREQMVVELNRLEEVQNGPLAPEDRKAIDQDLTVIRSRLEHETRHHQELLQREASLTNAVVAEQARWADFNSRLDELEDSLPGAVRR